MDSLLTKFLLIACSGLLPLLPLSSLEADVRLPGFYTDHMVLQREMPVRLRGWAEAGERVTVRIANQSAETTTAADGTWQVELPALQASAEPQTLSFRGRNTIVLEDVLVGEVWLCSGQSNMEWTVSRSSNAAEEAQSANHPLIRHIKFAHRATPVPQDNVSGQWQICSPQTVPNFTGVGYFFARAVQKELGVPIGLINSSWGGTRIEPWTPPAGFDQTPALSDLADQVRGRTPGTEDHQHLLQQHINATQEWLVSARRVLAAGELPTPSPAFPSSLAPLQRHTDPTALYNGMIHAIVGYPIRGAIWYQGESNYTERMTYYEKMKALISGWREIWQQGDFPFYYVQIAPFRYRDEDPTILPALWEAQAAVLEVPKTGMVVINDVATIEDIHPPNKQDVGQRLAMLALKQDYGRSDLVARSPELESLKIEGRQLRVRFRYTGGGLKTRDGAAPSHFEIAGVGSKSFQPANATIDGDSVLLSSADVDQPTAFRFAWHKLAEPNLTGGTGLPVGAVRGGDVPSFGSLVPGLEDQGPTRDFKHNGRSILYSFNDPFRRK